MDTKKLYYEDSKLRTFEAQVLACREAENHYEILLSATAFYPEGGGQNSDTGELSGIPVMEVHEKAGEVLHYTPAPLPVGETVRGVVDDSRRSDLTRQHSGEHIVSGLIHARWGYENVGFHMGHEVVTIDFNGEITWEELQEIEDAANRYIWENHKVEITWPDARTLKTIPYRSKKELTGPVRIVTFPGADVCACCGTHVEYTGEIGLVKFLSVQRFKGGVRVEMVSGGRAVAYMNRLMEENKKISNLLSAKPLETAEAVEKLRGDHEKAKGQLAALREQRIAALAKQRTGQGDTLLFEPGLESGEVGKLCVAVMETCGGRCAVFSGEEGDGYKYAVGQVGADLRGYVKSLNAALHGRGGGRDAFFAQGWVKAGRAEIEAFWCSKETTV